MLDDIKIHGDGPILSVDDDEGFRYLIQFTHARSDVPNELVSLSSGQECLDYLNDSTARNQPIPSIILMDVNMPNMNGYETVRQIRKLFTIWEVPVVCMLSSSNAKEDMRLTLESGANWYFEKPFNLMDLPIFRSNGNQKQHPLNY